MASVFVSPWGPGVKPVIGGGPGVGSHAASDWQSANAIDIGLPVGSPVGAVEAATVVRVSGRPPSEGIVVSGAKRIFGYSVTLRDASGREWFYTHLGALAVKVGQVVNAGAPIGTVGTAGAGWWPHLHLATSEGDPREVLKGRPGSSGGGQTLSFTRDGAAVPAGFSVPNPADAWKKVVPGLNWAPSLPGDVLTDVLGLGEIVGWLFDPFKKPLIRLGMIVAGAVLFLVGAVMLSKSVTGDGAADLAGTVARMRGGKLG